MKVSTEKQLRNALNEMTNYPDAVDQLRRAALDYHEFPLPGKIAIAATKQLVNQHDLALAYSPGVAAPCEEIVKDPNAAFRYTSRGNLVGVITNGTAVLGLGDIGPLASKPVMEGKGVLFKKFAGIDVFDIEINEKDPVKLVEVIAALEPTFGAINLEDIKAPECFYVERELRKRMKIPVFHDDQHGTAITVAAAMLNGLKVVSKDISQVKLVTSGAGAAALACLNLLLKVGLDRKNVFVTDLAGVVYTGRTELMDDDKIQFSQTTTARTLLDVIEGADVFLGLSAGGVLKPAMVAKMAAYPVIFALANPRPEITPEEAHAVRSDVVMATGQTGQKQREVGEFVYAAQSWARERRVITRLEYGGQGNNPRYVVTNLTGQAQALYDDLYCQRGEAENRIKEAQVGLFATRTSCHHFQSNQLRMLLAALGYVLIERLRALALVGTKLQAAQVDTLRCKLLKVAAVITRNTRRIRLYLASHWPSAEIFAHAMRQLRSP